ncbi:hypothetical protein [uncultured Sulfitobacter sp.]|uniref:hypothetical protein n=1 Tax=uncultured Sulfitobacter sp. TaxID=191468 RepID=UPI0030F8EEBB
MTEIKEVSERLNRLSEQELATFISLIEKMPDEEVAVFTIEACRALDYWLVHGTFSDDSRQKLSEQDLNIVMRGWNPLMSSVLKRIGKFHGIPLLGSTHQTIRAATSELHRLGRHILLRKTAELVGRGLACGKSTSEQISIWLNYAGDSDLFLDQIEDDRLLELSESVKQGPSWLDTALESHKIPNLQQALDAIVFRYETTRGTLVGYKSTPEIDDHYGAVVLDHVLSCRDKSGFHPEARINGVSANDVTQVVHLLVSSRLKHLQLVAAGKRRWPDINYWMSLSVWKPKGEVVALLSGASGIDPIIVSIIVDLLTLKPDSAPDLSSDVDPVVPLFIKISDMYLLEPVGALFLNPFDVIQRINADQKTRQALMEHREGMMLANVNGLFQGTRYDCIDTPVRLRREGRALTDIDGAVLDRTTGDLALFQLKWQDFKGATTRQTMSRAKNFVGQVQKWAEDTAAWISSNGTEELLKSLRLRKPPGIEAVSVRLFVIGQMGARFGSYGHKVEDSRLAAATWPQFVRLRYEIGPVSSVFRSLHSAIIAESTGKVSVHPMPFDLETCGTVVQFENLWNERRS